MNEVQEQVVPNLQVPQIPSVPPRLVPRLEFICLKSAIQAAKSEFRKTGGNVHMEDSAENVIARLPRRPSNHKVEFDPTLKAQARILWDRTTTGIVEMKGALGTSCLEFMNVLACFEAFVVSTDIFYDEWDLNEVIPVLEGYRLISLSNTLIKVHSPLLMNVIRERCKTNERSLLRICLRNLYNSHRRRICGSLYQTFDFQNELYRDPMEMIWKKAIKYNDLVREFKACGVLVCRNICKDIEEGCLSVTPYVRALNDQTFAKFRSFLGDTNQSTIELRGVNLRILISQRADADVILSRAKSLRVHLKGCVQMPNTWLSFTEDFLNIPSLLFEFTNDLIIPDRLARRLLEETFYISKILYEYSYEKMWGVCVDERLRDMILCLRELGKDTKIVPLISHFCRHVMRGLQTPHVELNVMFKNLLNVLTVVTGSWKLSNALMRNLILIPKRILEQSSVKERLTCPEYTCNFLKCAMELNKCKGIVRVAKEFAAILKKKNSNIQESEVNVLDTSILIYEIATCALFSRKLVDKRELIKVARDGLIFEYEIGGGWAKYNSILSEYLIKCFVELNDINGIIKFVTSYETLIKTELRRPWECGMSSWCKQIEYAVPPCQERSYLDVAGTMIRLFDNIISNFKRDNERYCTSRTLSLVSLFELILTKCEKYHEYLSEHPSPETKYFEETGFGVIEFCRRLIFCTKDKKSLNVSNQMDNAK